MTHMGKTGAGDIFVICSELLAAFSSADRPKPASNGKIFSQIGALLRPSLFQARNRLNMQ
jgi:hypothetical protein